MNVGSLFSGIGGFDLGLERAGMRTVWFCESDPFCQRVLAKHWPGVPCYGDICALTGDAIEPVDLLCGGFPCQDLSLAGKGAGLAGARSGLWSEYARLVGELRPRYVVVENVPALLARGLGVVLGDLAALGYDAEWDCLPASAFGAPHRRDRIWLVAYPADGDDLAWPYATFEPPGCGALADADEFGCGEGVQRPSGRSERPGPADVERSDQRDVQDADSGALQPWRVGGRAAQAGGSEWWSVEPPMGRVAHGIPDRLDQLAALGNALVPQIAGWIGRRILSYEVSRLEVCVSDG